MTNEEIERKTHETVAKINGALHTGQIEDVVYSAIFDSVSQVYEEAAGRMDKLADYANDYNRTAVPVFRHQARHFRSLKDSLMQETVPST